jgi:hypothetical protein
MNTENLEIYLSFKRLKAKDLARLLNNLSDISDSVIQHYYSSVIETPSLDILTINTGNSIKISLIEGWSPKISSNKKHDIVVDVPKKLGIPLVIIYLLFHGANLCLDCRNKYLDSEIKEKELHLKKLELNKVIVDTQDTSYKNVPDIKIKISDTLRFIYHNADFEIVKIDNIEIKSNN